MSHSRHGTRSVALSPPLEERWTLHHVLLDRIEQESTAAKSSEIDPPSIEVYRAFERLDDGETSFTIHQLEAMQAVLSAYHHSPTDWELERPAIEALLERVSDAIELGETISAE